jgi:phenylpyruvate tautomerase PptA (4-oxalocrotonate tautomerase family)
MPLLRFDLVKGRSPEDLKTLLDAAHRAVVASFHVPERDRYRIVHEHREAHLVVEDTGLDIPRSRNRVIVQVTSRPRERSEKQAFYKLLYDNLHEACGVAPSDVVVSITTNSDDDWSFGYGRAQFLTGEL